MTLIVLCFNIFDRHPTEQKWSWSRVITGGALSDGVGNVDKPTFVERAVIFWFKSIFIHPAKILYV